jgi:hypothetical protein
MLAVFSHTLSSGHNFNAFYVFQDPIILVYDRKSQESSITYHVKATDAKLKDCF